MRQFYKSVSQRLKHWVRLPAHITDTARDYRSPLMVLLFFMIVLLTMYFLNPFEGDWDTDIFGNLATEIGGVILTFLLLESYISHRERKLFNDRRQIALRSFLLPLGSHLNVLFNIYKATSIEPQSNSVLQTDPSIFFNEKYFNTIVYLDFAAKAPVTSTMTWGQYLSSEFKHFADRLENAADKFGLGLLPEDLNLVERIVHSGFLGWIIQAGGLVKSSSCAPLMLNEEQGGMIFTSEEVKQIFEHNIHDYHCHLVQLINQVNQVLISAGQGRISIVENWQEIVAPKTGSARFASPNTT